MTREMIKLVSERQKEAEMLVRYANPKTRKRPTLECVSEILWKYITYMGVEKPVVKSVETRAYGKDNVWKFAFFRVRMEDSRVFAFRAYKNLKGRSQAQKDMDKISALPSRFFCISWDEIAEE